MWNHASIRGASDEYGASPTNINIVAADQYDRLGAALLGEHPVAIIGSYEFLLYTLDRSNPRCLIEVDRFDFTKYSDPYTRSPSGKLIDVKTFIEEFTAGVFIGCLVLREEAKVFCLKN